MDDKTRRRSFIRRERRPLAHKDTGAEAPVEAPSPEPHRRESSAPDAREERKRIVVPRQERGRSQEGELDVELREVRYGAASRGPYLRVVPKRQQFTKVAPGLVQATRQGSMPRGPLERLIQNIKRIILGSPFATSQMMNERLTKVKALAIFSSDALSSSAYATEEILLVLLLASSGALHDSLPIAGVIVFLLAIVTISYRQTIKAYPGGGGAYIVAHENLGRTPGLIAGAALLVDYTLTVSVSVAAGVAAVTSAVPDVQDLKVPIGVAMIVLLTLGNLRGIREAGTLFAVPTYFFIASMGAVIIVGLVKVLLNDAPGTLLHEPPTERTVVATQGLSLFLILRAFSSGSAALTGIEAISNGVPAFKKPEVRNAQATMVWMALILGFFFLAITFLASRYGLVPEADETIVSKLGREVLGKNVLYYAYQVATALVLFLAANTSFNGFPPLAAILSRDRFLPRQFSYRGDRLAYSNGIMILAAAASFLLIAFGGDVTRLIPLYALGVFVSFTLSQAGMARRFSGLKEGGWRTSVAISAFGAVATGVVAVIIGVTKFTHGAWLSVVMMGILILAFTVIRRHYDWVRGKITPDEGLPVGLPVAVALEHDEEGRVVGGPPRDQVLVPVDGVSKISLGAVAVARELSKSVTAVFVTDDEEGAEKFREQWQKAVPDIPLLIIESPYRAFTGPMLAYVDSLQQMDPDRRITVVLPGLVVKHWWEGLLHNRDAQRLRPFLEDRPGIRVVDCPYRLEYS
jgi:amino acid transporter